MCEEEEEKNETAAGERWRGEQGKKIHLFSVIWGLVKTFETVSRYLLPPLSLKLNKNKKNREHSLSDIWKIRN